MEKLNQSQQEQFKYVKAIPTIVTIVSFAVGSLITVLTQSFTMGKNVATVATMSYVDNKHDDLMKYAEKLALENRAYAEKLALENRSYIEKLVTDAISRAFDHSDMNKKDTSIKIESYASKIDLILDGMKVLQSQIFEYRKR